MRLLRIVFALLLTSTAYAQTSTKGVSYQNQSSNPCNTLGTSCSYSQTTTSAIRNLCVGSDGASAVAQIVDTSTAWSNATAKLLSLRTNAVEVAFITALGNLTAGGATLNNILGWPVLHSTTTNGYMSLTSDGVGATWGGTGVTARQQAVAEDSTVVLSVNDVSVAYAGGTVGTYRFSSSGDVDTDLGQATTRWRTLYTPTVQDSTSVTIKSSAADSANAVGAIFDTTNTWSTGGNRLVSFREAGTEFGYITESNSLNEFQLQSRSFYTTGIYGAVSVRLHSTAVDGASAVAAYVDTSSLWSNASAKLLSLRTNGAEAFEFRPSGVFNLYSGETPVIDTPGNNGLTIQTNGGNGIISLTNANMTFAVSSTTELHLTSTELRPYSDFGLAFGDSTHRWSAIYQGNDSVGTAQTAGVSLSNNTAATAGNQKYSPLIELEGQGWKTDATAASQEVKWGIQTRPVQGAAAPTGDLVFWYSINGSAYAEKLSVSSGNGFMTLFGDTDAAAVGPFVAKSVSGSSIGTAMTLDATSDASGRKYSFISTGSTAGVGGGKFAIFDGTGSLYKFSISTTDATFFVNPIPNTDTGYTLGDSTHRWQIGYFGNDSVGTGQVVGTSLSNNTAATAGNQKYSPLIELEGQGWKTDATAASQEVKWGIQTRPVQGAANPDLDLVFWSSVNAGAYTERLRMMYRAAADQIQLVSPSTYYDVFNASTSGIRMQGSTMTLFGGGTALADVTTTALRPQVDVTYALGGTANRWSAIYEGNDSVGTAQTAGVSLSNNTAATAGNQKFSPMIELEGQGWKTDATAASQEVKWGIQTRPVQGAANPTADLVFWSSINGGAYAEKTFISSSGFYGSTATSAVPPTTTWTGFTFANSWVDYGAGYATCAYYKDALGFVHLRGLAKDGTSATAIVTTLPVGYRPLATRYFAGITNETLAVIEVRSNGDVVQVRAAGSTASLSFDNIHFYAEQ